MNREALLYSISESITDLQRLVLPALAAGHIADAEACLDMTLARLELLHMALSPEDKEAHDGPQ